LRRLRAIRLWLRWLRLRWWWLLLLRLLFLSHRCETGHRQGKNAGRCQRHCPSAN
jgi:hypothetical protein